MKIRGKFWQEYSVLTFFVALKLMNVKFKSLDEQTRIRQNYDLHILTTKRTLKNSFSILHCD